MVMKLNRIIMEFSRMIMELNRLVMDFNRMVMEINGTILKNNTKYQFFHWQVTDHSVTLLIVICHGMDRDTPEYKLTEINKFINLKQFERSLEKWL